MKLLTLGFNLSCSFFFSLLDPKFSDFLLALVRFVFCNPDDKISVPQAFIRNFADKDGKVWQGGGGRNPPPDAPHLVQTTPDIESLRPKSPPPKNQLQQPIPLMSGSNSNNRRSVGNSPQNATSIPFSGFYQDALGTDAPSPIGGLKGPEGGYGGGPENGIFEGFGFNACAQTSADYHEFESH